MRIRFATLVATLGLAAAGILTAGAQTGYADVVATTGSATAVTTTSAILNGVSLTVNPNSGWAFEYGTSSSYGQYSSGSSVSPGLSAVSQTINDLTPGTTYHFRLVVLQGDAGTASNYSLGADQTFTTPSAGPSYGTAAVQSHRLAVRSGATSIRFLCNGKKGSQCKGEVALDARTTSGRLVNCGSGSLSATGGHSTAINPAVGSACMSLLSKARSHTLTGEVRVTLDGSKQLLRSFVTLVGSVVRSKAARAA